MWSLACSLVHQLLHFQPRFIVSSFNRRVDHPKLHDETQWIGDEVVLMDKVYFGVGKSVVQPNVALQKDKYVILTPL